MSDPFDLQRFVDAQNPVINRVLAELRNGRKTSHWMWYVFPQAQGLGFSAMSQHYAIGSLDEARAYLAHPVLGPRLDACCLALLELNGLTAHDILGAPDDAKLRSSMTLFAAAAPEGSLYQAVLDRYFGGATDPATAQRLAETPDSAAV